MSGIKIRHKSVKSGLVLVPLPDQPFPARNLIVGKDECPTCQFIHTHKTVHLMFDSNGGCIVSEGVLEHLKTAAQSGSGIVRLFQKTFRQNGIGPDMTIGETIVNPPSIVLDGEQSRKEVDYRNNQQQIWLPRR